MAYPYYGNTPQPMYNIPYQQNYQPTATPTPYPIRPNNLQYGTEEEIKAFILNPNSQVMAIDPDPNKHFMYVKSTNSLGQPCFDVFKYEKIDVTQVDKLPAVEAISKDDLKNFASKEDIAPILERIIKVENRLSALCNNDNAQTIKK